MNNEIWKDLKDYEGIYKVSNFGNVYSIKNKKILKAELNNGYVNIILTKNKKQKMFKVHRLVAITFIPNKENKPCVNHKDYNRANNYVDNLEWVTHSENNKYSSKNMSKAKI